MEIQLIQASLSVIAISLVSLIGMVSLKISDAKFKSLILYFISFAAGSLLGDVFIHLLPELVETHGFELQSSLLILGGITFSLLLEKVIHWQHCHLPITSHHVHHFAWMNLFADAVHNFIDGLIIAASFLVSTEVGIATTVAVFLHEIPQEIGDFAVIVHSGISRARALFLNFLTALTALGGVGVVALFGAQSIHLEQYLIPFAAGTFIYIAGSDLIPELHKEQPSRKGIFQIAAFVAGVLIMLLMLLFGEA